MVPPVPTAVYTLHVATLDSPMAMLDRKFKFLIMGPQCFNVPFTMDAPLFGQSRATLNPDDLLLIVQRRYNWTWRDGLWARLHNLARPTATQDWTLSIRNVHHE